MSYRIGIDLGGTKIEGVALDREGNEIERWRIPTEADKGYDRILDNIERVHRKMSSAIGDRQHTLGIGTPGSLSPRSRLMRNANTVCLNGKPLRRDVEKRLARPVNFQNDANCFAMAEAFLGAGRDHRIVFGVIMGTGCGGGLVIDGVVHTGRTGIAGEWGHMSLDPNGHLCYCGQRGCVETTISGGGLEKRYLEQFGEARPLRDIENDYYNHDQRAVEFMNVFFNNFGRAMANLVNIIDPDIVVLGGGVSKFDAIYDKGLKAVERTVFSDYFATPIVKHQLGDSAGVLGAALTGI